MSASLGYMKGEVFDYYAYLGLFTFFHAGFGDVFQYFPDVYLGTGARRFIFSC